MKKTNVILPLLLSFVSITSCNNKTDSNLKTITLHYGNNITTVEQLNVGDKFEKPATPLSEEYKFINWYYNPAFSSSMVVNFPIEIVDDIEIFASWEIKKFAVTYHSNGDTYDTMTNFVLYGDRALSTIWTGTKAGYTFDCWCSDVDLQYKFNFSTRIYQNTDLYGRWTKNVG